jgi:hypothetical protein
MTPPTEDPPNRSRRGRFKEYAISGLSPFAFRLVANPVLIAAPQPTL